MDRIVLDRKIDRIGKEVLIKGPPLEALCFQGGRVGSLITLTDSEGNDFRGRVTRLSREEASILHLSIVDQRRYRLVPRTEFSAADLDAMLVRES